jgi:hypothetical protein
MRREDFRRVVIDGYLTLQEIFPIASDGQLPGNYSTFACCGPSLPNLPCLLLGNEPATNNVRFLSPLMLNVEVPVCRINFQLLELAGWQRKRNK